MINKQEFDNKRKNLTTIQKADFEHFLQSKTDDEIAEIRGVTRTSVNRNITNIAQIFGIKINKIEKDDGKEFSEKKVHRQKLLKICLTHIPDELTQPHIYDEFYNELVTKGGSNINMSDRPLSPPNLQNIPTLQLVPDSSSLCLVDGEENTVNNMAKSNFQGINMQEKINRILGIYANVSRERLYGVDNYLTKLKTYLEDKDDWLMSVVGHGGVGKTSIVEKLVRDYGATLEFNDFAWVTAKRTSLGIDLSKEQVLNSSISLPSLISDIAKQLNIALPTDPNPTNILKYLRSKLKEGSYLVVIDNLETLEEYKQLVQGFNPSDSLSPSKIILTSREKLQSNNNRIRETDLKGLTSSSTLDLIRYKGDHVERIATATDDDLRPIFDISGGIPLIILLIVNLIATNHQLTLQQIIKKILQENKLASYLYDQTLASISDEALNILDTMAAISSNSSIYHEELKELSKLDDYNFNNAILELAKFSLLQNISRLTDQPRYAIHSMLYEFLRNGILESEYSKR